MQKPHFDDAADQQCGVERDYRRVVAAAEFFSAVAQSPMCVPFGDDQLDKPLEAYSQDEQVVPGLPAQQHKFRTEAGPHRNHQPERAWRRRIGHGGVQHIQY